MKLIGNGPYRIFIAECPNDEKKLTELAQKNSFVIQPEDSQDAMGKFASATQYPYRGEDGLEMPVMIFDYIVLA